MMIKNLDLTHPSNQNLLMNLRVEKKMMKIPNLKKLRLQQFKNFINPSSQNKIRNRLL
jgi:hypothetical protein